MLSYVDFSITGCCNPLFKAKGTLPLLLDPLFH